MIQCSCAQKFEGYMEGTYLFDDKREQFLVTIPIYIASEGKLNYSTRFSIILISSF